MKIETKQILLEFDEVGRFETPTDFDYDKLISRIGKLKIKLETIFTSEF
nr:hypothetical protein [uncultured Flavobacterium sp.]